MYIGGGVVLLILVIILILLLVRRVTEDNDLNDPEDVFDASDPPGERLRNFVRRLTWIGDHLDREAPVLLGARLQRLVDDLGDLRDELDP